MAIDRSLFAAVVVQAAVALTGTIGFFAFWWGLASLVGRGASSETEGRTRRVLFGLVLLTSVVVLDQALYASSSRGLARGAAALVAVTMVGVLVAVPMQPPRRAYLGRLVLIVLAAGCSAWVVLVGVSTPPIFGKVHRGVIAAAVITFFEWSWMFLALSRRPFRRRTAVVLVSGGLVVFATTVAIDAHLPMRGSQLIAERFEAIRSFRHLGRSVCRLARLNSLLTPEPHAELAARRVQVHPCVFVFPKSGYSKRCSSRGALAATECSVRREAAARSVLLLSIDSLRADYFGLRPDELPNLNRLQENSLVFEHAMQTSCGTALSLFSMHTGRYAIRTSPVVDAWPAMAHAIGGEYATHMQGWKGFLTQSHSSFTEEIIADLQRLAGSNIPFLMHAHYMSTHIVGLDVHHDYGAILRQLDAEIGRVLNSLEALGLARNTVVIVTGDHGEELRSERGYMGHGYGVWDTSVVTPLIMRIPGAVPRRETGRVSGVDIWPTVLDALGASCAYEMQGVSLLRPGSPHGPIFTSSYAPNPMAATLQFSDIHAVSLENWKLAMDLREGTTALYDLQSDPGETHNLADDDPTRRDAMTRLLAAYVRGQ
jgi:hypothetical protein